jgi:hypothetical protein
VEGLLVTLILTRVKIIKTLTIWVVIFGQLNKAGEAKAEVAEQGRQH